MAGRENRGENIGIKVGTTFTSFDEANTAIANFFKEQFHPVRPDKKETVRAYNARVSETSRVTTLRDEDVFSYR